MYVVKKILASIMLLVCLLSCEKQYEESPPDEIYDLFPLTVGTSSTVVNVKLSQQISKSTHNLLAISCDTRVSL